MRKYNFFQKGNEAIRVTVKSSYSDDDKVRHLVKKGKSYSDKLSTLGQHRELFDPKHYVGNKLDNVSFYKPTKIDLGLCGVNALNPNVDACLKRIDDIHKNLMGYGRGW